MVCLELLQSFMVVATDVRGGHEVIAIIEHPVSQAFLALGGIGIVSYIGANRGYRIRLPHRSMGRDLRKLDAQDSGGEKLPPEGESPET